jgi:hypothetical protein
VKTAQADGTIQWSQPVSDTIKNALLDPASAQVYQLDLRGDLSAYALPGGDPGSRGVARLETGG